MGDSAYNTPRRFVVKKGSLLTVNDEKVVAAEDIEAVSLEEHKVSIIRLITE